MFKKMLVGTTAALALGLAPATPALAGTDTRGSLGMTDKVKGHVLLGQVMFRSRGDHLYVRDTYKDRASILVEVWWDGRLRRTCWDSNGAAPIYDPKYEHCDFKIPSGKPINIWIAEADKSEWRKCRPSEGCGRSTRYVAGPFPATA